MSQGRSEKFEVIDAVAIGSVTLVGVLTDKYPIDHGNCFDLKTAEGKYYKILNFVYENLEYALEKGLITWPIKIHVLQGQCAVIHDERIPHDWYKRDFCQSCTPYDLLPLHQKLAYQRDILTGVRVYYPPAEGKDFGVERYDGRHAVRWGEEQKKEPIELTGKSDMGPGLFFAPYMPILKSDSEGESEDFESPYLKKVRVDNLVGDE